jgi:hypothetical protein
MATLVSTVNAPKLAGSKSRVMTGESTSAIKLPKLVPNIIVATPRRARELNIFTGLIVNVGARLSADDEGDYILSQLARG